MCTLEHIPYPAHGTPAFFAAKGREFTARCRFDLLPGEVDAVELLAWCPAEATRVCRACARILGTAGGVAEHYVTAHSDKELKAHERRALTYLLGLA